MALKEYLDSNGVLFLWTKLKALLSYKVDKVDGKQLSTEDYTTEEKQKLSTLASVKVDDEEPTDESVNIWVDTSDDDQIVVPEILDSTISTTDTWSSQKISDEIDNAVSGLSKDDHTHTSFDEDVEFNKNVTVTGTLETEELMSETIRGASATFSGDVKTQGTATFSGDVKTQGTATFSEPVVLSGGIYNFGSSVQGGTVAISGIAGGSTGTATVTFPKAFRSTPFVMVCCMTSSDAAGYGDLCFAIVSNSTTTTQFQVRAFNASTTEKNPSVRWLAIGTMG